MADKTKADIKTELMGKKKPIRPKRHKITVQININKINAKQNPRIIIAHSEFKEGKKDDSKNTRLVFWENKSIKKLKTIFQVLEILSGKTANLITKTAIKTVIIVKAKKNIFITSENQNSLF